MRASLDYSEAELAPEQYAHSHASSLTLTCRMPRVTTHRGTLWTLRRNGETARAEIVEIEGVGLELRYTCNERPIVQRIFTDGADLLREAAIERFERERRGWTANPRAAGNTARPARI
jgi:hypothetical protein